MSRPPTPDPCPPDDPHWDNDWDPEMIEDMPPAVQQELNKQTDELLKDRLADLKKEPPEGGND